MRDDREERVRWEKWNKEMREFHCEKYRNST